MIQTNFLAVLVAAIVATVVGMVWYGPLFGKEWSKMIGLTPEKMAEAKKNGMTTAYGVNFIAAIVMAYVLSNSLADRHIVDIGTALYLAFWIWLGFIATVMLGGVLWEKKPMALYWIQSLYYLVSLWVMALVIIWLR
jgi:hypothetical protein